MKKTLIALAAVAATTVSFAQVTLSGKLAYGYESAKSTVGATSTTTKGLKVTDGNFTLAASEDLGGGMKATASMDVQSRGRGTDISGRDGKIVVSGGFGAVTIGAIEAGNGILGLGGAGAPTIGLDNNDVLSEASNVDILAYSVSVGNGIGLSVSHTDGTGAGDANAANTVGGSYAAGAIAAKLDMTNGKNGLKRTRLAASYDLGMAKVGFGMENKDHDLYAAKKKQTVFGISAPVGAMTVGLNYGVQKQGADKTKGTDLGLSYSLSKRTTVYAQYQNVKFQNDDKDTTTRIKLMHAF